MINHKKITEELEKRSFMQMTPDGNFKMVLFEDVEDVLLIDINETSYDKKCKNCGKEIDFNINKSWFHLDTGQVMCGTIAELKK